MKYCIVFFLLLSSLAFFGCDVDDEPTIFDDETSENLGSSEFTITDDFTTLSSKKALAERFTGPDRFLAYATDGVSKWEVYALTREGKFNSDLSNSLTYIPDTTDLSIIYNVASNRAEIEISEFDSDTSTVSLKVIGTAHHTKSDSVNFNCFFSDVPLIKD